MIYLLKFFRNKIKQVIQYILNILKIFSSFLKILIYFCHRKPFGLGYDEYKWFRIRRKIMELP